jgi:hydrogenase maturation protease
MNQALVDKIARAVLYEGYSLYPYRPSVKSQQRWTFGVLYPRSWSEAQSGSEACTMQTECLVQGGAHTTLQMRVRFLHLQDRLVERLDGPPSERPDGEEGGRRVVDRLQVDDRLLLSWQEAVEQEALLDEASLSSLSEKPERRQFVFSESRQLEPVRCATGETVAVLRRTRHALAVVIDASATPAGEGLFKVRVRVENDTSWDVASSESRDSAQLRSLISTHTVIGVRAGELVSLLDPPESCRALAASCQNLGTWPVLVGEAGEKDTMLSAPIILYDYPQIAPESPGDLFDSTEIDEILTLRILTLTEQEKQAAAAVDERVRTLLRRTEALEPAELLGLHGAVRGLRAAPEGGLP